MKKLILLLVAVSLFFNLHVINVSAASANPVVAKYDSANTALFVNADFGTENADLLTTMTLFRAGEMLGDSSLPMLFQSAFTNDKGIIDVSISIPSYFSSDKYTVRVSNSVGTYDADFLYAKNSDIRDVMLLLNDAETETEISGIITSNYQNLALDPVVVAPYVSELSKAYKAICSQTDYTNETVFYSDFMQCLAASEIACGNDTESVLNNYKLYIGSSIDEMRTYPSSVKSLLISFIGDSSYSDGLLSGQIPMHRVLAFFKSSSTWGEAKLNILGTDSSGTKYIDNFDVLSPSLTHYSQVKNINLVYEKIFSQRASITSFDNLKSVFESSAKEVYEDEIKKPVQNNNSSSGGSSVPSASIKPGTSPEIFAPASKFTDTNGHWAQNQIEELADKNVISGYPDGSFGPNKNVTRAEFAKMIISFAGLSGQSDSMSFDDVNSSDWFYSSVSSAVYHGLINGISELQFAPNTEITRQDACVIIYRYLGEKISSEQIASFIDFAFVSDYASDAVSALSENGILSGYEDKSFKPQNPITRAETAVILSRVTAFLN